MSVQSKIQAVQNKINTERAAGGTSQTADKLQVAAAAAILKGGDKVEAYMQLFEPDAAELARMLPDGGDAHTGKNLARAYLMGNGNCGPNSPQGSQFGLLFGVGGILDED
jgi:hypothetical protein